MALTAASMAAAGRIGPNAITRVAQALRVRHGTPFAERVYERAGLLPLWHHPPEQMVPEGDVRALHLAMRAELPAADAAAVARAAGQATADYLLAHRIPQGVQRLLKALPASLAARLLIAAIRRHAWTFTGSGYFSAEPLARGDGAGTRWMLAITGNPLCQGLHADAPACDYHAATFERLFQVLVHPRARVVEVDCEACGGSACRFALRW